MATDIVKNHFLFRKTPKAWHPYIKLMRLDRPIGTWLLLLPGLWSISLASDSFTAIPWKTVALFTIGAVLMRGAGCVVNDLWDRNLDAAVERTRLRPLPAGDITPKQALIFLGGLLFFSLLILLQFNLLTIALGVLSLLLVATYPLMKRITWWPQLFLGFTFNWGALMGWAAITGKLSLPAILLYIGGIFWTLAYDTIYAHQDKEDDALIGIKSTARLFGKHSDNFVAFCFAFALLFFVTAKTAAEGTTPLYALLLILLPTLQAIWQVWDWKIESAADSLKKFRSNRDFGLLLLLIFSLRL
jgi:4-hydroxybenzoate polyprenyltransferase